MRQMGSRRARLGHSHMPPSQRGPCHSCPAQALFWCAQGSWPSPGGLQPLAKHSEAAASPGDACGAGVRVSLVSPCRRIPAVAWFIFQMEVTSRQLPHLVSWGRR